MSVDELKAEVEKHLTERERFELGQRLLSRSLGLTPEQETEIMRRAAAIEGGAAELIDGEAVDAEARTILNEKG